MTARLKGAPMETVSASPSVEDAITIASGRDILVWAAFVLTVSFALLYLVGFEQGAFHLFDGEGVHELMHDGRHLFAFPCH
jgi:hypothetical protein